VQLDRSFAVHETGSGMSLGLLITTGADSGEDEVATELGSIAQPIGQHRDDLAIVGIVAVEHLVVTDRPVRRRQRHVQDAVEVSPSGLLAEVVRTLLQLVSLLVTETPPPTHQPSFPPNARPDSGGPPASASPHRRSPTPRSRTTACRKSTEAKLT
jgi:hypothetical protein